MREKAKNMEKKVTKKGDMPCLILKYILKLH